MDSLKKSEDSWNTVNYKKKNKNENDNDIIVFFNKVKEELDKEFSFLNKENSQQKINKNNNQKQEINSQNIFNLLSEDS